MFAAATGILVIFLRWINNVPVGQLEFVNQRNAYTNQQFLTGDSQQAWDGDHILELQILTNFWENERPQNGQWQFIWDQMQNVGRQLKL